MSGLYLEEFKVGTVVHHPIRRTITEADNVMFSMMTMNPQRSPPVRATLRVEGEGWKS